MRFPVWLENFQLKYINPVAVPIARFVPGITVIRHRGRTSGRGYQTAVSAYRKGSRHRGVRGRRRRLSDALG
ncbi:MAG: hypothetical protein EBU54_07015 [Mycobacteriaceae bacterium]|nr:hypothetical protein [Mycobacteriaceae bacterium]